MEPLIRNTIPFTTEEAWLVERSKDLTSTNMPALFGISPYLSPFELWHRKHDKIIGEFTATERMKWGNRLQDSIARGIAEDNKWSYRQMKEYLRIKELRIGSSFDYAIFDLIIKNPDAQFIKPEMGNDIAILEIKNVDSLAFKEGWEEDEEGNLEAPLHIELQVQHQLLVSGLKKAYIGALVGGNRVKLLERVPDIAVHEQIIAKSKEFWASVDAHQEPKPDFHRDADFIKSLYQSVTPLKTMTADERITTLAERYKVASEAEKQAKDEKEAFKAELLTIIGDTEKVKGEKFSITANVVGPADISYHREGYRNFKVSWKKEKEPNHV